MGSTGGCSGDLFRFVDFEDFFEAFLTGFRFTSEVFGIIVLLLGCPYESLAKRSLLSASSPPPASLESAGDAAKARRVCFF